MTMAMSFASSQAVLAVSCHKLSLPRRACLRSVRVLPSLRPPGSKARGLTLVRATSQVDTSAVPSSKETVPDTEISITKVENYVVRNFWLRDVETFPTRNVLAGGCIGVVTSFGTIGLTVGTALLSYGFGAYFTILPGSEWSAIMLTYGFPLAVIGFALKYAELKPVACVTYKDAFLLRESQATDILKQVRSDVTRYRYGDEQHLEEALKRIFRYGQGGGISRRYAPRLQNIREEVRGEGRYTLTLVFEAKNLKLSDFEDRQAKFQSFFGPGVIAEIAAGEKADFYEVRLISSDLATTST